MKKALSMLLTITMFSIPAINSIDSYREYNSKLLVIDESINTFNIESLYKVQC